MHDKEKAPRLGGEGADEKVIKDNSTTVGSQHQTSYSCGEVAMIYAFWWRAKLFFGKSPFKWVQRFFIDALRAGGTGLVDVPPQAADRGVSRGQRLGAAHRELLRSVAADKVLPARYRTRILSRIMPAFTPHFDNAGVNGRNCMPFGRNCMQFRGWQYDA